MSIADEIAKLGKLRDEGALTEEEFAKAKSLLLDQPAQSHGTTGSAISDPLRNFFRSRDDRWLGGVCGGLGELTTVPSWFWRLLFCLLFFVAGAGLLIYVLMWIFVPERPVK
jgi:phage shock protein C